MFRSKASGASDRAVMADTDEQSIVFAREARTALQVVQHDIVALTPRLQRLQVNDAPMREFTSRFEQYRTVDQDILELAIENTNLKAQRLSFGPVREVADSLRDDLQKIAGGAARKDRCDVEALVAQAIQSVREIQVIQAPHIAEADEGVMTRMEAEMAKLEATAAGALKSLAERVGPDARPTLTAATATFTHFNALSRELVALSRRNSNVRSLALSLRRKPALIAGCDAALAALQEALAKERFTATR